MRRRRNWRRTTCLSENSEVGIANVPSQAGSDAGRQFREQTCQAAPGAAEICRSENDAGTDDAEADLGGSGDGKQKGCIRIDPANSAKQVASDDRRGISRQGCGIGHEVAKEHGDQGAGRSPKCQPGEKQDAVLREARHQNDTHNRAGKRCRACGTSPCGEKLRAAVGTRSQRKLRPRKDCRAASQKAA